MNMEKEQWDLGSISEKTKDLLALIFLLVLSAYLRPLPALGLMGRDETSYAFLTKHVIEGTFLDDYIFTAFHPLYSFICAPVAYLFNLDPELAGRVVSYTFGVISVVPVYFIGKMLFSRTAGFVAGFMTASFPLLIKWAGIVQAQTTYSFMLIMSMLFVVLFFKQKLYRYAILAGIFSSLAYLARAEGMGIFAGNILLFLIFAIRLKSERKRILKGLLLYVLLFMVIASPYMYALKLKTGEVKFTNKLTTAIRAAVIVTYGLDYEKFNYGKADIDKIELYKMAIKAYPKKLLEGIRSFLDYYGLEALALAFIPVILCFFTKVYFYNYLFFVPYLYVLLILPFFFVAENYFISYAPFVFLLSGYGVECIEKLSKKMTIAKKVPLTTVIILLLLAYGNVFYKYFKVDENSKNQNRQIDIGIIYQSYRDFGKEISSIIKPGSRIMARFNIVAWYAGGEFVNFPDISVGDFLNKLNEIDVDYIVFGPAEEDMRKEIFDYVLEASKGIIKDDRFQVVYQSTNYWGWFFLVKVKKKIAHGRI